MEEHSSSKKGLLDDKRTREFAFFLIKLVLIWLSWKFFIWFIGEESVPISERHWPALSAAWEGLNSWLRAVLLQVSNGVLHVLGYKTDLLNSVFQPALHFKSEYVLRVQGHGGISLGNYCLGFQLMYYFSMLFLVSAISPLKRAIGVVGGILLIQAVNLFRIVALILIDVHAHHLLKLYHDHVFNVTVAIVLLTFYWLLVREKKT